MPTMALSVLRRVAKPWAIMAALTKLMTPRVQSSGSAKL
jgi:hypothetical protein